MNSIKQSVTKGFAILSTAGLIVKILSFIYIPFLIYIIGDVGYGIYMAAYNVYVLIYVLTNSGIPVAISKLVSELVELKNYRDAVRSFKIARFLLLILGTVMSLLMLFTAGPLSKIIEYPKSRLAILALSPTLLFTAISSAYRGYFQGRGNMMPTAVSQIIEQITNTILTLLFAYLLLKYGIEAACAGGTIGTSIGAMAASIYLIISYRKHHKFKIDKSQLNLPVKRYSYKQLAKKIANYSIPITLSVGMTYAGNLIDTWNTKNRLIAAGFSDDTATALFGYLTKYVQLMNVPISIITALATAIIPAVSAAMAVKNVEVMENRINYAFRLSLIISVPSAVGLAVLSGPIYSFIKFGNGYDIMMYGAVVLVLMSIVQIQNSILQSCGKLYNVTFNLFWGIVVKVILNYFLIAMPKINIYGAIIGSIAGYVVPIVLNGIVIDKLLRVKLNPVSLIIKPAVSSVVMGIGSGFCYVLTAKLLSLIGQNYVTNAAAVLTSIAAGGFIYLYAMVILGGITREDLDSFPARLRRLIPSHIKNRLR